ncbi:MAG TPA: aldo/keto reductase [Candidatus Acidoferrum sp.]|nr:aldo/keto reductase [Candidatus Acidoferrum sp.]
MGNDSFEASMPNGANDKFTRREFVRGAAAFTATAIVGGDSMTAAKKDAAAQEVTTSSDVQVPKRPLGKTGAQVSALGVGGYHLGSTKDQQEANELVAKALDAGITFFDNAWDYHQGLSEERLGTALQGKRDQAFVMTKVCTHGRGKDVAMQMLEQSLRRLQTDHLDLWQIHEVIYYNDPDLIFRPGGAAEALLEAKQQGKVRFIGFTGHKDPAIHLRMLAHDFPFDTVQMPLNACDATFRSFETQVMPEANNKGVAVLGMKSRGGSGEMVRHGAITAQEGLRYAMSLPVATTISGMDSIGVLDQNLEVARGFQPISGADMQTLRDRVRIYAADGRYELFKTTKKYDGDVGREQHHYPTQQKLPA